MVYTYDDLKQDVDWMIDLTSDEDSATSFIISLIIEGHSMNDVEFNEFKLMIRNKLNEDMRCKNESND